MSTPPLLPLARPLLLGSQSPRRRELLAALGLPFEVLAADIPEAVAPGEDAEAYQERIVRSKLRRVLELAAPRLGEYSAVLVADTEVVLDGAVLGKPVDVADAFRMLRALAGRAHAVVGRLALALPPFTRGAELAGAPDGAIAFDEAAWTVLRVETRVHMAAAPEALLRRYAATGEGLDKAGAYAAQGLGSFLVERVEGSYTNVVGLPTAELCALLERSGLVE